MNEDKLKNFSIFRISVKVRVCDSRKSFLLRYAIYVKISKMTKTSLFYSIHQENTCKTSLHSNLIILIDFNNFTENEDKLQNLSIFRISAKVRICDFGQNLKITKTS